MKINVSDANITTIEADAIVVGIHEGADLEGVAAVIDAATGGAIVRLRAAGEITGEQYELVTLLAPAGIKATQVLVASWGAADQVDRAGAYRWAAGASRKLSSKKRPTVVFCGGQDWEADLVSAAISGIFVGSHGQDLYRAEKKQHPFAEVHWSGGDTTEMERGRIVGQSVNLARDLVNEPPQAIYPVSFAEIAQKVAGDCGLDCEVWDTDRLGGERCGALLAVAQGSVQPPRMVVLKHNGGSPGAKPLALVGKGVTFDSGGLSLKPSDGMLAMKCDMAGAASVLAAMQAIAQLQLPVNVVGLMGLVENMVSGNSYKLGDVLTARNGRTIEVHNTDAEGRLVLADALCVAVDMGAERIIDVATLTGACMVALGNDVAGLMSNNQDWCDAIAAAAERSGEPVWQLPMFSLFNEQIKSDVADIKNVGQGRWGGAITAAKFLEEFVENTPWTHIDIAGPSFLEKPKPWCDAGGTGFIVKTLVEIASSGNHGIGG